MYRVSFEHIYILAAFDSRKDVDDVLLERFLKNGKLIVEQSRRRGKLGRITGLVKHFIARRATKCCERKRRVSEPQRPAFHPGQPGRGTTNKKKAVYQNAGSRIIPHYSETVAPVTRGQG